MYQYFCNGALISIVMLKFQTGWRTLTSCTLFKLSRSGFYEDGFKNYVICLRNKTENFSVYKHSKKNFDRILTEFWLNFGLILAEFRLNFGWILAEFWLNFGWILAEFWLNFDWILAEFWLNFDWILTEFWLNFDWILAAF